MDLWDVNGVEDGMTMKKNIYISRPSWGYNFRENHCALNAETLSISKLTMGLAGVECRTKEHFHLSAGHAGPAVKLLKTRGNWMKAVVVTGEKRKTEEKAWNENGVRRKKDIRPSSALPAPSTTVSTRSFRIDPQPLIPKNRERRAIKIIRL